MQTQKSSFVQQPEMWFYVVTFAYKDTTMSLALCSILYSVQTLAINMQTESRDFWTSRVDVLIETNKILLTGKDQ